MSERVEMIESRNGLFAGEMVRKPRYADIVGTIIYDGEEISIYECPECRNIATIEECDVIGAEPGCVFCNVCSCEFEV